MRAVVALLLAYGSERLVVKPETPASDDEHPRADRPCRVSLSHGLRSRNRLPAPAPRARSGLLFSIQLGTPQPERAPRPRRDAVGGLIGPGSAAVVVDDLDVVPVRVEHERAVVARVVNRALAGRALVLVARGERGSVERAHRGVLARGEREVDVLG